MPIFLHNKIIIIIFAIEIIKITNKQIFKVMATNTNIWLVDANFIARMRRLNTSSWNVLDVINDRFFVVRGSSIMYQVQRAGYTGAGVESLGATDLEAVQRLNSLFNVGSFFWMSK